MTTPSVPIGELPQITRLENGSYLLTASAVVPQPLATTFEFFASAENLERITPAFLNFRITTPLPIEMRDGALIEYRLRLHGIPIRWRTRITEWVPHVMFVDQQTHGPYRLWHHEHRFEAIDEHTTRVTDLVTYRAPFGALANRLLVARDLTRIFTYRSREFQRLLQ